MENTIILISLMFIGFKWFQSSRDEHTVDKTISWFLVVGSLIALLSRLFF